MVPRLSAFALLGAAALSLSACSDTASNPAPPRLKEPVVLAEQPSTIRIPVSYPIADIERRLNDEVPPLLHRIDEPQRVCIKTKSRLLPDISCRLVGTVTRGPIRLTGAGDTLRLSMPVTAHVEARHIGKIIKRETATGAIALTARVKLGLRPDWTPTAKVDADYGWTNRLGIDFLGQRITFASKVDPKLKALLAQLEQRLPHLLARQNLREIVQPIWAKGFTSVRVKSDPLIWARFTPQQVGFSGYRIEKGRIILGFSGRARTQTIFGERPQDPPVTPLPRLMPELPPTGINVHVPVLVRYDVLERAARKVLVSNDYRALDVQGTKVDALFRDVTLYGTADNRIALGVDMALRTFGGALSTKGKVWFVAKPRLDIDGRTVGISDLVLAGQTDSRAFNLLLGALNATALRQRLIEVTRYDFSRDYDEGLRKAEAWLEEQPFEGFVFRGDLKGAAIRSVRIAPDGLLVMADAAATGAMTYDPPRAAQLVAERRARRAARIAREAREQSEAASKAAPGQPSGNGGKISIGR